MSEKTLMHDSALIRYLKYLILLILSFSLYANTAHATVLQEKTKSNNRGLQVSPLQSREKVDNSIEISQVDSLFQKATGKTFDTLDQAKNSVTTFYQQNEQKVKVATTIALLASLAYATTLLFKFRANPSFAGSSVVPSPSTCPTNVVKNNCSTSNPDMVETLQASLDSSASMDDASLGNTATLFANLVSSIKNFKVPPPQGVQAPSVVDQASSIAKETTKIAARGSWQAITAASKGALKVLQNNPVYTFLGTLALMTGAYFWWNSSATAEKVQDVVVGGAAAYAAFSIIPMLAGVAPTSLVLAACAVVSIPAAAVGRAVFKAIGLEDKLIAFFEASLPAIPSPFGGNIPRKWVATFLARLIPQILAITLTWSIIIYLYKRWQQMLKEREVEEQRILMEKKKAQEYQLAKSNFEQALQKSMWKRCFHKMPNSLKAWVIEKLEALEAYITKKNDLCQQGLEEMSIKRKKPWDKWKELWAKHTHSKKVDRPQISNQPISRIA